MASRLFSHGDLILQFTRREMEMRHKGSRLGHAWALLRPLTLLGLYLFVFGFIFGGRFGVMPGETTFDFAVALFLSLSFYGVISEAMSVAPTLVLSQPNFVKKVVFPLEILSVSSVATSLYHGLISIVVALLIALLGHRTLSWDAVIFVPALLVPLALMSLGISWGLAAIGLFLRDIGQLIPFLANALIYASAVVYAPSKVAQSAPAAWAVLRFNPLLWLMDESRRVILWHQAPNYPIWAYLYGTSAVIAAAGYAIFVVLRPFFAEVI
ncbi:MAG TPA: ABC transporter permease [Opitutaceae bacterium]|jgi:lipopolysaccharide transport system permease protein|nr:ABC transporter permease [Opitutaceae bacterium]